MRQLLAPLDPSPFLDKDLDRTCDAFTGSWAPALPHGARLHLTVHVEALTSSAEAASPVLSGPARAITRESLTIIGWVAMWRPVQIFLYDGWPLGGRDKVYENLRLARVSIVQA